MKTYFQHINEGIRTTVAGMKLTLRHLWAARKRRSNNNIRENSYFNEQAGMVTLQYPLETMPIPDNGRYRLHNEMDDCIVCDKCAKVCPVDCIDIEPIKATAEVGKASDGSPIRLYAAKFDIDMAKCCYCGLCTTVCPTECLTMTKTFDYSEFDVREMNYHYANLTPEQAEAKKMLYEQFLKEKEELKKGLQPTVGSQSSAVGSRVTAPQEKASAPIEEPAEAKPKPAFRPTVKPAMPKSEETPLTEIKEPAKPKPVFVPKKPIVDTPPPTDTPDSVTSTAQADTVRTKPVFRPAKPKQTAEETPTEPTPPVADLKAPEVPEAPTTRPKPVFRPSKPKPVGEETLSAAPAAGNEEPIVERKEPEIKEVPTARPKPLFKPTMKPKGAETKPPQEKAVTEESQKQVESENLLPKENTGSEETKPRPKPVFKPTMKPKKEE